MNRQISRGKWILFALSCAATASLGFALRTRASAADEIPKLATLMEWKQGTIVADIGAGDGSYAFTAVEHVGATGKVFATEIDAEKLKSLRAEIKKRDLQNVTVVESGEVETNLPASCCDAIFLRRVYHHLTKPVEFDASLLRSLKPGGKLAIIDFPPRAGLPLDNVPSNRGGHGVVSKVVVEELSAAGLKLEKTVSDWPDDSYCLLFVKK